MVDEPALRECVVLVVEGRSREQTRADGLRLLERRGYAVRRSGPDRGRTAEEALAAGYDELLWIDADVDFHPTDIDRLRRHPQIFIGAACPELDPRVCVFPPGTRRVRFGAGGGVVPVLGLGFHLVLTRRALFEAMRRGLGSPASWFAPAAEEGAGGRPGLDADFAFCERARRAGASVLLDTTIRLRPVGLGAAAAATPPSGPAPVADVALAAPPPPSPPAAPPLPAFREPARPLPPAFPRLRAYFVSYPANRESLRLTLEDFRRSDWGEEPIVFVQPEDWPTGKPSASRNYRRVLERARDDDCDFAVVLEDDVRVNRWLRRNLTTNPLVRRDQCDYLGLFMPDLIASPWLRRERRLGYRLAKPLYVGPDRLWERHRIWGSQGYVLSRRFLRAALERWDDLAEGQDSRVLAACSELVLPLWYTCPCLLEHAPLTSAFGTPTARAPDFDREFRLEIGPGFQPPEGVPGRLSRDEGSLLWELAADRRALESGTGRGRATVCLAQRARRVVSVDAADQSEAEEWTRRYQVRDRVAFRRGGFDRVAPGLGERFDLVLTTAEGDPSGVGRDVEAALAVLEPGGSMAFLGYPDPRWPETRRVVDDFAHRLGWRRVAQEDFLGVFQTRGPAV